MEQDGSELHVETDAARGGSSPAIVRYVLAISLLLAIIAMSLIWIIPALMQGDVEEEITATGIEQSSDDSGNIDGVVIDDADEMQSEEADVPIDTIPNETAEDTDL